MENNRKLKILLVEDDRINRIVVQKILQTRGMEVVCASDGFEALELYQKENGIDLVIMDIQLPGMDGMEAERKIRDIQHKTGRIVPVIALTAYAADENLRSFISAGFDDCAQKPVDYEFLVEIIKKHTLR